MGCILYTLLVGKPPFETQTLKDTYARIKRNEYHVPYRVGPLAKNLISKLLQHDPAKRPTVNDILKDEFMTMGYLPPRLPVSCLTMAPRFDPKVNLWASRGGPLTELNKDFGRTTTSGSVSSIFLPLIFKEYFKCCIKITGMGSLKKTSSNASDVPPSDCYLSELLKQLRTVVESQPAKKFPMMEDEAEDPKSAPMVLVSKWVDYSDKYGFGYALSDESIGVLFNDVTKLLQLADGQ